jgi:chorismate mutase
VSSFHISFHEYYTIRLNELRKKIDKIDYKIYKLLDKRLEYSKQTKAYKLNVTCSKREQEIIDCLKNIQKLNDTFVENIWTTIFEESKRLQNQIDL